MFQIYNSRNILYSILLQIKRQRVRMVHQFKMTKPTFDPSRNKLNQTDGSKNNTVYQKPKIMPPQYYYKLLGLVSSATSQQIKAAYYKLAKKFHPDASLPPQAATKFQEISNAYNILSNDLKRQQYDQLGYIIDDVKATKSIGSKGTVVSGNLEKYRPTKNGEFSNTAFMIVGHFLFQSRST